MTSQPSELSSKHPMTIKDELVPRACKLLKARGSSYSDTPGYCYEEFVSSNLRIVLDENGILQIQINRPCPLGGTWEDCYRGHDGLIVCYEHDIAVMAVEELRRLMVLDDLADV